MNRRFAAIGVVALVLVSGCSALVPGDAGEGTDTLGGGQSPTAGAAGAPTATASSSTASASPTATATPTANDLDPVSAMDSLPPGVTEDGVADKSALLDSYRDRLDAGSYALVTDIRNSTGDDSRLVLRNDTARTVIRVEPAGRDGALELYDDSPTLGTCNGSSGEVSYGHGATPLRTQVSVFDIFVVNFGTEWIRAMEWDPAGVATVDGEQRLVLEASSLNESVARDGGLVVPPVLSEGTEVRDVDARMAVTGEGLVRHANVTVTADVDGSVRTVTTALDVESIEADSLTEPDWLSDAPNVELSTEANGRLLALDHAGGAAVESGTTLSVTADRDPVGDVTVPEELSEGDTVYVHRAGSGDDADLRLSVNERPTLPENATAFFGRVVVGGERDGATFRAGVDRDAE